MDYIYIDKTSKKPIYKQIADSIEEAIDDRRLVHHYHLPTEKEIADLYNLSLGVVKKAFVALEETGKVWRTRGKGSYVVNRHVHVFSPKDLRLDTETLLPFETLLIETFTKGNTDLVTLNLFDAKEVVRVLRIYRDRYYAVVMEESFVDTSHMKRFIMDVQMERPVSEILRNCDRCHLSNQNTTMTAISADSKFARMFDIEINAPMIKIESAFSNQEDEIVAVMIRYLPSEFTIMESEKVYA